MKLSKLIVAVASIMLVGAVGAQNIDNWRSGDGALTWKSGTGLCWQNSQWTPATASKECAPQIATVATPQPQKFVAPPPAPVVREQPAATPPSPPVVVAPPAAVKVTYSADTFFDFDKSILKPEGKAKLDDLADKIKLISLEVIVAVGHTDSIGTDLYNKKLSERRADAVKTYLISRGIDESRVVAEGKGESQPIADNRTSEGRAKNRRVEIEVVGTRKN